MDGFPKAHTALLNQVQQQHVPARKFLGHLNHAAKAQIGQFFRCTIIPCAQLFRENRLVAKSRNRCDFFQVEPQGIVLFQVRDSKTVLHIFFFLLQPQCRLTGGDGLWKGRKVQNQLFFTNDLECILHCLVVLPFQHVDETPRGNGSALLAGGQIRLPGALFKLEIHHSKKSSNPMLSPIAWSLSMA